LIHTKASASVAISKILTWSIVDGPGNRLVLFLQGCNYNCPTCHNPHTIGHCNDCGDCIPTCHVNALSLVNGEITFDPTNCDQCDACLDVCPINANPMVQHYSIEQILDIARKHHLFLSGITVSGGEATTQLKWLIALFSAIKADQQLAHLTCFIDSNGHLPQQGWQKLLPVTDGVMLDIKGFDQTLHQELTGRRNLTTLRTAKFLQEAGKLHELRFLVIPEKTDSEAELNALIKFIASLGRQTRIKLNAFQHHGVKGKALEWPKANETTMETVKKHLQAAGITNVVTPAIYL
jgi:pyruvate formate lyase activating enzyme